MSLNELFQRMSDKEVAQAVGIRHDAARESYRIKAVIEKQSIETLGELVNLIVDYIQHQYKYFFENSDMEKLPEIRAWSIGEKIIEAKYTDGLKGALRSVQSGVNGGVKGLVDNLYQSIKSEHEKDYREYIRVRVINKIDWNKSVAMAEQLLRSLACIVPRENQLKAEDIASNLGQIIDKHVQRTSLFSGKNPGVGGKS